MVEDKKNEEAIKEEKVSFFVRHKDIILEIIRFLLVGGLATIVDWAVSFLICSVTPNDVLWGNLNVYNTIVSTACGFIVGLLVNYFLSIVFVFKNKKDEKSGKSFKDFLLFAFMGTLVLLFQFLLIFLMNDLLFVKALHWEVILAGNLTWGYILAKVFATAVGLVLNYILRKIFIFK